MDNTTDVKIGLTVEDRASAVVKSFTTDINRLGKALERFTAIKTPDISAKIVAAGRAAVEATKAHARAVGVVTGMEEKAARQRTAQTDDAERQRQRINAATMRDAREKLGFGTRMAKQRAAEEQTIERQRKAMHSAAMASIRQRMAFVARMAGQRLNEERTVERERQRNTATAERDAASTLRRQIAGHRYLWQMRERMDRRERADRERDRRETIGHGRDAWDYGRGAVRDFTRPLGTAALAAGAAGTVATKRILGAESDIDSAEIDTRIYGGLDKDAARRLREQWAAPLAEALGTGTDKLLTAWVDATKLGIPAAGAQAFAELSTKTSEAWSVPFAVVTDILGTVNTILTSKGEEFSAERLRSVANAVQHLAAKQSTTPEKLLSYLQRGAGAAQVLGMSQEAGLAFGSASTSLGNQAGQSGRMFDYLASRVIELPRLTKQKGDQGKQARDLVRALGYGSAEDMDRQRRADPDAFLPDFMDRFNRIKDTKKQDQAIRFFTGREWLGEFGRMVKGIDTYREAVKLAKEAKGLDAIGAVWELHRTKLGFVFKQFRAGWLNVLGELGTVLSPMARQAGDTFLRWTAELRSGGLKARFRAMIDGFIEGLGFRDLPALMEGILGKPGEGTAGAIESWGAAARGFGQGLRDVANTIKAFFSAFTGGNASPETIGRWTARILGFSAALLIAAPVVSVLGAIGSAVLAFAFTANAAWRVMKAMGLVGATSSAAAAGGAAAGATAAGAVAGGGLLSRLLGSLRWSLPAVVAGSQGLGKGEQDAIVKRLGKWAQEHGKAANGAPIVPPTPQEPDPLRDAILSLDPALAARLFPGQVSPDPAPRIEKQSFNATDWRSMIQPASLRADGDDAPAVSPGRIALDTVSLTRAGRIIGEAFLERIMGRLVIRPEASSSMAQATTVDESWRRHIEPASGTTFDGSDEIVRSVDRLGQRLDTMGTRFHLAAFSAAGDKAVASFSSSANGAGFGGSGSGAAGGSGSHHGLPNVPDWFGGKGITSPMLKGEAATNAKTAFDFFKSKGLSTEAASGILASMKQESGFNPQARGDGGRAHGLFQHHPDRRAAIQRATGINMSTASVEKQLEGAWWEMQHGDAGAQRALRILQRPGISAREAGGAFVQNFERPKRDERASRGAMAEGFAREFGASGKPAPDGQRGPVVGGVHPLDGKGRLTSDFGMRRHPIHGDERMHKGIDLAAPAGTLVKAMRDGIASLDRSGDVKVTAEDGSSTTYRHISAKIAEGAKVAAGQVIGSLRAHDPRSTGPHLHLESRNAAGNLVDPKILLARAPAPAGLSPEAERAVKSLTAPNAAIGDQRASTGGKAGELAGTVPRAPLTPAELARSVPSSPPASRMGDGVMGGGRTMGGGSGGGGMGGGGGAGPGFNITINGANRPGAELAGDIQRHVAEAWSYRSHDMEPELT